MTRSESAVDRHVWETRFAALEEELPGEPVDALAELLGLLDEMVAASEFDPASDSAVEAEAVLRRAREIVERAEAGEEVRHDDAIQAAAELRSIYRVLLPTD